MLRWAGTGALALGVAGCSAAAQQTGQSGSAASAIPAAAGNHAFLDSTALHTLDIAISDTDLAAVLAAYQADRSKDWVEADVTIDGMTYRRAGVRLKGNSTIFRLPAGSAATAYPWLVRLDKFVDGQAHHGVTEIVVRTNNTASALNEALALDLLTKAGLAAQPWAYAAVSVAGEDAVLRLVLEHPSDPWVAATFGTDGVLYKAQAGGNYDYLGDSPSAYAERFDVEAGEDDLAPLTGFLKWLNEVDDTGFAADLHQHLEVPAFTTYLALERLIDNYDAIDGPGNNSYLWWAKASGRMTVVPWDHNLTFGVSNRPGAGGGGPAGAGMPGRGGGAGGANAGNRTGNVLSRRFEADTGFTAQLGTERTRLTEEIFTSGYAADRLDAIAGLLAETAAAYLSADTLATEKAAISAALG